MILAKLAAFFSGKQIEPVESGLPYPLVVDGGGLNPMSVCDPPACLVQCITAITVHCFLLLLLLLLLLVTWHSGERIRLWPAPPATFDIYVYIHTYIHTYIHACMHACMHTHTHTHTHTHDTHTHTHTHTCMHAYMYIGKCINSESNSVK
jgi:hypothetical protein